MSTDFETKAPDEIRETVTVEPHYFLGKALEPFSLGRQLAVQRIRTSNSELENAMLVIFLCTLKREEINALTRTQEGIAEFRRKMEEWGEAQQLGIGATVEDGKLIYSSENTRKLVALADTIWSEIEASNFKPRDKAGPDMSDPNA